MVCGGCREVMFCDRNCQRVGWKCHKERCKEAQETARKAELAAKEEREQPERQKREAVGGVRIEFLNHEIELVCMDVFQARPFELLRKMLPLKAKYLESGGLPLE